MVLRDYIGSIIFFSCRFIQRCTSALEAEMAALMEGVDLALERSPDGLIVETDCSVAMRMIMDTEANRSLVAFMVGDIFFHEYAKLAYHFIDRRKNKYS